jgi:hypothetical protein
MRKYLIGMIVGLIGAVALSSVAWADVTGVSIESSVTPAKGDKKVRNGISDFFSSNDMHSGALLGQPGCLIGNEGPSCFSYPPSVRSLITFPTSLKFDPGNLPDCNLSSLVGQSTAGAKAACPGSIVGSGENRQAFSDGSTRTGVITLFNGAPSGGFPSLYLHVDLPGVTTKPILNGVIRGNTIDVSIPPVPGTVIERFATTINKVVSKKTRNRKTGKVKKTYYLSANCSKPNYTVREDVTYQNGKTLTATTPGHCKQTNKKK